MIIYGFIPGLFYFRIPGSAFAVISEGATVIDKKTSRGMRVRILGRKADLVPSASVQLVFSGKKAVNMVFNALTQKWETAYYKRASLDACLAG